MRVAFVAADVLKMDCKAVLTCASLLTESRIDDLVVDRAAKALGEDAVRFATVATSTLMLVPSSSTSFPPGALMARLPALSRMISAAGEEDVLAATRGDELTSRTTIIASNNIV